MLKIITDLAETKKEAEKIRDDYTKEYTAKLVAYVKRAVLTLQKRNRIPILRLMLQELEDEEKNKEVE